MWFRQVHHADGHLADVVGDGDAAGVVDPRPSEFETYRMIARRMATQIHWALFTSYAGEVAQKKLAVPVIQPDPSSARRVLVGRNNVELQHPDDGPPRRQAYTLGQSGDGAAFVALVDRLLLPIGPTNVEVWAHHEPGNVVAVVGSKILVGQSAEPPHLDALPEPWLVFAGAGPLGSVASVGAVRRKSTPRPTAD